MQAFTLVFKVICVHALTIAPYSFYIYIDSVFGFCRRVPTLGGPYMLILDENTLDYTLGFKTLILKRLDMSIKIKYLVWTYLSSLLGLEKVACIDLQTFFSPSD
jgi:hypothetical protein